MAEGQTLLKTLLVKQHAQKFETFCALYTRTAHDMDAPELAKTTPSKAQYYRWLTGQLKGGVPYPDACRVLEQLFPGHTAAELFAPAPLEGTSRHDDPPVLDSAGGSHLGGIVAAFASRCDFCSTMPPGRLIEQAKDIAAVGLSLNLICQQFPEDQLRALIEAGMRLRCLFLDPDGEAMVAREREEGYRPGVLAALTSLNISLLMDRVLPRLTAEARERLQVAVYDEPVRFNILLLDGRLAVVQPYLPVARGIDSPTFVVEATEDGCGVLPTFVQVFESMWERGKPL